MATKTTIRSIRLPAEFYTNDGRPNIDPNGEAVAYVTDSVRYGVQYEDGHIDWLGRSLNSAFGDGAEKAEIYRVVRLGADGAPGMDDGRTLVSGLTLDEARQWIFDRAGTDDLPEWDAEAGDVEVYGEAYSDHAGGYAIQIDS